MQQAASDYSGFTGLYIDGAWRLGSSGKSLTDRNPFSGETVAEISQASVDEIDAAAAHAQKAWAARP